MAHSEIPQSNCNWVVWFPKLPAVVGEMLSNWISDVSPPTISPFAAKMGIQSDPISMSFMLDEDGDVLRALCHLFDEQGTCLQIDLLSSKDERSPSTRFELHGTAVSLEFDHLSTGDKDPLCAYVTFSYTKLYLNGNPVSC